MTARKATAKKATARKPAAPRITPAQIYNAVNTNSENLEVGDTVRILFHEGFNRFGCSYNGSCLTDHTTAVVIDVNDLCVTLEAEDGDEDCYPFFAVKLESRGASLELNDEYTAVVDFPNQVVKVGCQSFPFGIIRELSDLTYR